MLDLGDWGGLSVMSCKSGPEMGTEARWVRKEGEMGRSWGPSLAWAGDCGCHILEVRRDEGNEGEIGLRGPLWIDAAEKERRCNFVGFVPKSWCGIAEAELLVRAWARMLGPTLTERVDCRRPWSVVGDCREPIDGLVILGLFCAEIDRTEVAGRGSLASFGRGRARAEDVMAARSRCARGFAILRKVMMQARSSPA